MNGMMQHGEKTERFGSLTYFFPGKVGGLPSPFMNKGQLIFHAERKELLFRILKQRADSAGNLPERRQGGIESVHKDTSLQLSPEIPGTQPVGETHERAFAAAALTGDEHHFTGPHAKIDVAYGGYLGKRIGICNVFKTDHDFSPGMK